MKYMWLSEVSFLVFGIFVLGVALRGLFSRKPIIYSSRWMVVLIVVLFAPILVHGIASVGSGRGLSLLLPLLMPLVVLSIVLRTFGRYSALGVSSEYFNNALHAALQKLDLPFEESLSKIKLTSLEAELTVAMQPKMGVAQLSIDPSQHRSTLKQIVQAMRDYFATVPGRTNLTTYAYYLVFGVITLIFVIYFSRYI